MRDESSGARWNLEYDGEPPKTAEDVLRLVDQLIFPPIGSEEMRRWAALIEPIMGDTKIGCDVPFSLE
jgi:hypothetical protein